MALMQTSRLLVATGALFLVVSVVGTASAAERFIRLSDDAGPEALPAPQLSPLPQAYSPYQTTPLQKAYVPCQKSLVQESLMPYQKPLVAYQQPMCDQRKITYRKHHLMRRVCCDPCLPPMNVVLQVMDPCTGCPIDVPVCVPGCCTGLPKVCGRKGLFGRPITEFDWCCGYRVKVVMKLNGDLIVHCYGR